jgi:phosphoenolpyruvate carboxykinase (ATP)
MSYQDKLAALLEKRGDVKRNIPREQMIRESIEYREAIPSANGALATWTPVESSGRSPKDTYLVKRPESEGTIDWNSPNNIPLDPATIDMVIEDALKVLGEVPRVYAVDRLVGADPNYALPVHTVLDKALYALFIDNMFRPWSDEIAKQSCFSDRHFTLIALPYQKLDPKRYEGRLRVDPRLGHTSTMCVAMDFDRWIGVVYGSAYCGSIKKLIFTVMNYASARPFGHREDDALGGRLPSPSGRRRARLE